MTLENTDNTKKYSIGYARVSTPNQSCEAQINRLVGVVPRELIFCDEGVSGIKSPEERPAYQRMKEYIFHHRKEIENVYVFEISRIGRDAESTMRELLWYIDNSINIIPLADSERIYHNIPPELKPLIMGLLTSLAKIEHKTKRERVMAGLEVARLKGKKLGRKTKKPEFEKIAVLKEKYGWSTRAALRFLGINENTFYKYKKLDEKRNSKLSPSILRNV